ncbi:Fic family protein [Intrasporangium mesophilum]
MRSPDKPPAPDASLWSTTKEFVDAMSMVPVATDRYLPWDELQWRPPPNGLTVEQWWTATRIQRAAVGRRLPFEDSGGRPFTYAMPDEMLKLIERIGTRAGGHIGMSEPVTNPATRDRYVVRSLMEEAITSSQLEGATTTRRVAKEMLREGRAPRTKSERMIWNNYRAMEFVRDRRDQVLTPEMVKELHFAVTEGTSDDPADGGRLQRPGEERVRVESFDGQVAHVPPPAEQLEARLAALCAFANGGPEGSTWVPALVRAVVIHFMVGYDHYFVDGNGRVARALFYWSVLRQGLWLSEFVAISPLLKAAPVKYMRAYLNTEYDAGDTTYFVLYQLGVLDRAFDDLESYLEERIEETQSMKELVAGLAHAVNHRQLAILEAGLRDPHATFTAVTHARSHRVSGETARQDLQGLEAQGLLELGKVGRAHVWYPVADLRSRLGQTRPGGRRT